MPKVEDINRQVAFWQAVTRDWEQVLRSSPDDINAVDMLRLAVGVLHTLMTYREKLTK